MISTRLLARVAAAGYFVMMGLHTWAFSEIMVVARAGGNEVSDLISVLWLSFSMALLILGGIVWLKAPADSPQRRATLVLASLFPLAAAALQVVFMGPIPPVAMLAVVGLLTVAAAFLEPRSPSPAGPRD